MWNTLSIQYNSIIEQEWDEHFRVSCEYGSDFWKTVSFSPFNVELVSWGMLIFRSNPRVAQLEIVCPCGVIVPTLSQHELNSNCNATNLPVLCLPEQNKHRISRRVHHKPAPMSNGRPAWPRNGPKNRLVSSAPSPSNLLLRRPQTLLQKRARGRALTLQYSLRSLSTLAAGKQKQSMGQSQWAIR